MIKNIINQKFFIHRNGKAMEALDLASHIQLKRVAKLFALCIATAFIFLFISSCKKLVDIPPPTQNLAENKVYAVDATAIGVLDGMYTNFTLDGNLFQGKTS